MAGPVDLLIELFNVTQLKQTKFAERFIADEMCARRGWSQRDFCRSLRVWVIGGGAATGDMPEGLAIWQKAGQAPGDLVSVVRDGFRLAETFPAATQEELCEYVLPEGCNTTPGAQLPAGAR